MTSHSARPVSALRARMIEDHDGARLHRETRATTTFARCGRWRPSSAGSRYGDGGGFAPLPAATDAERHAAAEHQQCGLRLALLLHGDARPAGARRLTVVRQSRRLPAVLSVEEIALLLQAAPGPKYKAAFATAYGAGLRMSGWSRSRSTISTSSACCCGSSRAKDAKTATPCCRRSCLSCYATGGVEGRRRGVLLPRGWLFPGRNPIEPLSTRQLNRAVHAAADAAGIKKRSIAAYAAAQLRHTPAGTGYRYPCHPGAARPCQARHHGPLHPCRQHHDPRT